VVIEGRGDRVEKVLAAQAIEHRMTRAGALADAALTHDSLLLVGCTGEIEAPDVERVAWFVLTGGHLFTTCWALTHTAERALPGVLTKAETSAEVVARVPASCADTDSPYVEQVFLPDVRPIYSLIGAHLIEVVDPERAEVLLDSPECAEATARCSTAPTTSTCRVWSRPKA
jgi:hypothetical protein